MHISISPIADIAEDLSWNPPVTGLTDQEARRILQSTGISAADLLDHKPESDVSDHRDRLYDAHDRLTTIADTAPDASVGEEASVQMAEVFEEAAQTIAQGIPF